MSLELQIKLILKFLKFKSFSNSELLCINKMSNLTLNHAFSHITLTRDLNSLQSCFS